MSELNKVAITKRIVHISTLDKPVEIKCCNKYHNFCSKYRLFRNIGRSEVRIPRYYTKLLKWAFYVLTIYGGRSINEFCGEPVFRLSDNPDTLSYQHFFQRYP